MKKNIFYFLIAVISLTISGRLSAQTPTNDPKAEKILLPNGWSVSPAGRSLPLGDLPLNMQVSPSGRLLAVTNNGEGKQSIQLIDVQNEKVLDEKPVKNSWYGLKFSSDGKKLYVSGGNDNTLLVYLIKDNKLKNADTLTLGKRWPSAKISPAGIDIDDTKHLLYTVTKEDNSLYVVNLDTKKIQNKVSLGHEAYACILSADKSELYISLWGGDKIAVYNTNSGKITGDISTGNHPNEILLSKNGKFLYVANANDNSVSVINLKTKTVIETLIASVHPTTLSGSTTNGLALSPDGRTLFIANADNNCLAVFDVSDPGKSRSMGFISTGWYPTNVKVAGKKILVSNGKGFSSMANPRGPGRPANNQEDVKYKKKPRDNDEQYIGSLFMGTLSIIDMPDDARLKVLSSQVYANTPYNERLETTTNGEEHNPIPHTKADQSPIKYVFYVMKENRTYDQVLGDIKTGNGDSSLCLFPDKITPNQHALAKEFVLLDNFYVDAEVSADGHNWSMAAYANDYIEKTWITSYGGHGGTYDYAGSRAIAFPKNGFIWDNCMRNNVSMRNYGEFADDGPPYSKALRAKTCAAFPGWNLAIQDVFREKVWEKDFDSLISVKDVPKFNLIYFPNDHTSGLAKGAYTPFAAVADNDEALGLFIEHLSKSPIWKESAVFVLEDDAQAGSDHVDAHRSTAYVISPYVKKGTVNHTMYSTSGVLRTMEMILGMPPLTQYDAAALPLSNCFTNKPDTSQFTARPAIVNLKDRNTASNKDAVLSGKWNFAKADAAPDRELNEIIWRFVKGETANMPAPKRSAFVILEKKKDDD
jgi:YVTN family beta-propeller protein